MKATEASTSQPAVRITTGEFLGDRIVDLVVSEANDRLEILSYDGSEASIAPFLEMEGCMYAPPGVGPEILDYMHFPRELADFGSIVPLFHEVAAYLRERVLLADVQANVVAWWLFTTWLPELFLAPQPLCVRGPEQQVHILFCVLHALCRRGLRVARLTDQLRFDLFPTLLVWDPTLSLKQQAAWAAANRPGFMVGRRTGSRPLVSFSGPKAIFVPGQSADGWGENAICVTLLPVAVSAWDPTEEPAARTFVARLFRCRLEKLFEFCGRTDRGATPANGRVGFPLLMGFLDEPEIKKALAPFVEAKEQVDAETRQVDPAVVVVEAVWGPTHDEPSIRSGQILERVNALLSTRGCMQSLSDRQLGRRLQELGIDRLRDRKGMVVEFTPQVKRRIHELVIELGLGLKPTKGCSLCGSRVLLWSELVHEYVVM